MSNIEPCTRLADYNHIMLEFFLFLFYGVNVSHCGFTVTDVTIIVDPRLATIAAMVLTAQLDTSATVLAVSVVVVEVAERWSA